MKRMKKEGRGRRLGQQEAIPVSEIFTNKNISQTELYQQDRASF